MPLNWLGGTTFPQVFASKSSSDSLNYDQEGATESASHVYFLSLSLQIATKFGTRGLGNRMPVLPGKNFYFYFQSFGSMISRLILSKVNLDASCF